MIYGLWLLTYVFKNKQLSFNNEKKAKLQNKAL